LAQTFFQVFNKISKRPFIFLKIPKEFSMLFPNFPEPKFFFHKILKAEDKQIQTPNQFLF